MKREIKKTFKTIIKEAISEYISWVLGRKTKEQERKEAEKLAYKQVENILRCIEKSEEKEENIL